MFSIYIGSLCSQLVTTDIFYVLRGKVLVSGDDVFDKAITLDKLKFENILSSLSLLYYIVSVNHYYTFCFKS